MQYFTCTAILICTILTLFIHHVQGISPTEEVYKYLFGNNHSRRNAMRTVVNNKNDDNSGGSDKRNNNNNNNSKRKKRKHL